MKNMLGKLRIGPEGVIEIADTGRDDLAKFMTEDATVGVEVGVAFGGYSDVLMKSNPDMKLYGVDSYTTYKGYKDYALNSTMRKLKEDAHALLDKYPNYTFVEKFSMDAVKDFEDESLDFVYIDANHEEPYVTQDITEWAKKVKPGGVVAGHDYGRVRSVQIRYAVLQAINAYAQANGIQLLIWGLNSKSDRSLKRDTIRSWSYIKS